jgi:hypothetical protein
MAVQSIEEAKDSLLARIARRFCSMSFSRECYAGPMPVWPDIVVTKPDSPEVVLAVEVNAGAGDMLLGEAQIKDYMAHQSCPVGMLVTPEDALFFRNPYTGYEADTIQRIGACRTSELLGEMPDKTLNTEEYLVLRVERWLEALPTGGRRSWPPSAAEAIESFVLPAVNGGIIRATGPRWRRTGS